MGIINVEGLGPVQIEGDKPTAQEESLIIDAFSSRKKEAAASPNKPRASADNSPGITNYLTSPDFARLVLETGLGIGGSLLTGGAALPAAAARVGFLARPFLTQLLKSSLGSAAGSATGALIAHPLDPKDPLVIDIAKGAASGFFQEAAGAPVGIKAGEFLSKLVSPKIKLLEGVQDAENILKSQSQKIIDNPANYTTAQIDAAKNNFLTPALKTDNRLIDTLQNITESSYFGAGELLAKKEGAKTVGEAALNDFINPMLSKDPEAVGQVFKSAITGSEDLWKAKMNGQYAAIDKALQGYSEKLSKPIVDPITGIATIDPNATKIVDMTGFKKALLKFKEEAPFGGQSRKDVIKFVDDYTKGIPDQAGFKEANEFRSDILRAYRDYFQSKDAGLIKKAGGTAADEITKAIQSAADTKGFPTGLKELYNDTNTAYRLGKEDFNASIIEKLMDKPTSTDLYNAIIRNDKGETLKTVMNIIKRRSSPEVAQSVSDSIKGNFLQNALSKATVDNPPYPNFVNAKSFKTYLDRFTEIQKQLFSNTEKAQLDQLVRTLGTTQGKLSQSGKLGGGLVVQFKQSGALIQLGGAALGGAYTGDLSAPIAFLVAPKIVSKALLSPGINKFLFQGMTAPTYPMAAIAMSRLAGKLTSDGLMSAEENNSIQQQLNQRPTSKKPIPVNQLKQVQPQSAVPTTAPVAQAPTSPNVNMFAANQQAQTPSGQAQMPQGQPNSFTNIPQNQLDKYSTLFGKVV